MNEDRIIDKLVKLKSHMESAKKLGSEEEAYAFAQKIQELLTDYKLDMTDVELAQIDRENPVDKELVTPDAMHQAGVRPRLRRIKWMEMMAAGVAAGHYCRFLVYGGSSLISFVGRKTDTQIASYMYLTLCRAAEELADKAYAQRWKELSVMSDVRFARGFRKSFLTGFAQTIQKRYVERRNSKRYEVEMNSDSRAIIRLDSSKLAIERFFEEAKIKSASKLTQRSVEAIGFRRGVEAGKAVNLDNNALGGKTNVKRLENGDKASAAK
jgi:hypothetical protein